MKTQLKTKMKMKTKFLTAVLSGFMLLTGCSSNTQNSADTASLNTEQSKALDVVKTYLDDFREGKLVEADKCLSSSLSDMQFGKMMDMVTSIYQTLGMSENQINMVKNTLSQALARLVKDYEIESVSPDTDNKVTVSVDITGISVQSLASLEGEELVNAVSEAIAASADTGQLDDATFQKALDTIIQKIDETGTQTSQATFTVSDENGTWLISETSNFGQLQGAIPGNFSNAAGSVENQNKTIEESIEEDAAQVEESQ